LSSTGEASGSQERTTGEQLSESDREIPFGEESRSAATVDEQECSIAKSSEGWADEIMRQFALGQSSTMELARSICAAKSQLHYGQWTQMWKSGRIPFSKRKGEMLAVIGKNLAPLDAQTSAHLPWGWNILYCLAQLNRKALEQLVEQGTIHPGLTLREARELLAQIQGRSDKPGKSKVRQRLQRFSDFVRDTINDWQPEEREAAKIELSRLIEQIDALLRLDHEPALASGRGGRPALGEFHVGGRAPTALQSDSTGITI
jgi:hypothetical protein